MSEVINVQQRLPPMKGDQVIPVGLDGTLANPVADHADSQPTVNSSLVREDSVRNHVHINGVGSLTLPDGKTALVAPMFSLHPETVRLAAYVAFWAMVLLALILTSAFVDEDLSNSPLVKMFGYNNVCILWDYEPARSLTAMFYPLVEIPLALYVVLNFVRCYQSWRMGQPTPFTVTANEKQQFSTARFTICAAMFPVQLIFVLWFRMIFVVEAFKDVKGHTLGFHGLMIALVLIAVENFLYYDAIGKLAGPRWISIGYLTVLVCVTTFKMIVAWSIFAGTPLWSVETKAGQRAGHFLDITWMVLASVIPAFLAYKNRLRTPAMMLSYTLAPKEVF